LRENAGKLMPHYYEMSYKKPLLKDLE